jgi:hypothetical protein
MFSKRTWAMMVVVVVVVATLGALAYSQVPELVRGKSHEVLSAALAFTEEMDITSTADLGSNHDDQLQADEWVVLPSLAPPAAPGITADAKEEVRVGATAENTAVTSLTTQ